MIKHTDRFFRFIDWIRILLMVMIGVSVITLNYI